MAATAPLLKNDGLPQATAAAGSPTTLGVLAEGFGKTGGDQRVSISPDAAKHFIKDGYVVLVESGAGTYADFSDAAYTEVGCQVLDRKSVISKSKVVFSIMPPTADFGALKDKVLISWVGRLTDDGKALVEKAASAGVTLIDVTAVPRITIAQQMDTLSSQAKVAGHRAVIEAAHAFGRFHGAEMTAAGKYPPAGTFVLGCGVAGLEAIGKSKALGSAVRAWDVRDVSDQVASMGAKWVKVDFKEDGAGQGGYAKESSAAFQEAQKATFLKVLSEVDIAISTAAIPGRKSPLLITKEAVAAMKPGSVIVDLAAAGGGNCELTRKGESYVTENKVTIIGYTDLPARMAMQASAMYGQNMVNMLRFIHSKEGSTALVSNLYKHLDAGESGDIVSRSIVCCRKGAKIAMPPPPQPTPPKPKTEPKPSAKAAPPSPAKTAAIGAFVLTLMILLLCGLAEGTKNSLLATFLLAGAAGYQAVWGVAHALHTPLMSVTNAISGLTAVGGLLLMQRVDELPAQILAQSAVAISSINIFGGFVVSQRMLNLFRKPGEKDHSVWMLMPGVLLIVMLFLRPELNPAVSTISAILCVAAIGGLASISSADSGCKFGIVGVFGAVAATLMTMEKEVLPLAGGLLAGGGVVGLIAGKRVSPMALPQTVALFHSLVGAAATCTSIGSFYETNDTAVTTSNISAIFGDIIGAVTLTGSLIAFGKLNGNLNSRALNLPGKNYLNILMLLTCIGISVAFFQVGDEDTGVWYLTVLGVVAAIMGLHLVASVGGGDMPVCITVLNSYSGWALVAEGFLLRSPVLTVVGSLIGCSGAILTKIMCDAMNRDIFNVIFGGMNTVAPAAKGDDAPKIHQETSIAATAEMIASAKEVLIVPGYGMAVARAQGSVGEIATVCRANGVNVRFGIHPVAGRMPGQMNVLLAEAGVPHEWVFEMDEVNPEMDKFDVCLIVGANDITNSAAQEVEGCAIWGMPVIEVWRGKKVIFCKRTMAGGYADLDNPVFYKENTEMLLGDAKKTADGLSTKLRERFDQA
mmetsp:Transcript_58788/g.127164  ORF Transcript_58788/g.127164 Transcript_58788/m.127164 type:complete len:1032 (+) Transcript_58788:78-3173(+)|eukprot:CAMPEP_0170596118 /NCGR_PEP_ID=MMETSP0224-20130122/14933_1 /TAXON_ID=285029 /ORGANISM="Togula jolla, Strain CCCM 725" /LENGTH=1031 /DNA_ID=CAMNT_0010920361 /DNA_START=63 /DNA_END=3158 /DNA_ORIENTATION=-